jgi:hypothetical protein
MGRPHRPEGWEIQMSGARLGRRAALFVGVVSAVTLVATGLAGAAQPPWTTVATDFKSPLFGLAKPAGGRLLVADSGAGPTVVLPGGGTRLLAELPDVTDVLRTGRRTVLATVSGLKQALYRVSRGRATEVADLGAFEKAVDPDRDGVESNPFDLARRPGGPTLVADAAGNSILAVGRRGRIDWVATLPERTVSTQPLKNFAGCPDGPPDICGLPPTLDADPVPTSVEIGPDGHLYVGELTGFPATPGTSRIWRIKAGTRHARCGSSPACSIVRTGPFTSVIDLRFGRDLDPDHDDADEGIAYVVELDEASWLALEQERGTGGTVNACEIEKDGWHCTKLARNLPIPTAVAVDGATVYSTLFSLVPGQAQVVRLH